ncbi:hypothetical protein ACTJJ0_03115 [Chitinophaga sp. 22321]|uniref:Uncharacterized protein n=1 Tax=Chitinophaga hostae TaxID=2831022 RepID=A0ABS5JAL2_9BACT|nr:hypothetical protein [Chitinophaga hostae]MBS0032110.1 hypothetical protein [Chitinophaga hostae]
MQLFSFHQHTGPKPGVNDDGLIPAMHEREHNTNEGGEFLDDAIRMDDEPATEQENSSNAGSRQD